MALARMILFYTCSIHLPQNMFPTNWPVQLRLKQIALGQGQIISLDLSSLRNENGNNKKVHSGPPPQQINSKEEKLHFVVCSDNNHTMLFLI